MNKKLPNVFANKNTGIIKNNKEQYYSKEEETKPTLNNTTVNDNVRPVIINKKINDLFNSSSFVYKVDAIVTTKNGDKEVTLIARGKDALLTINNETILIEDILDIKRI